MFRILFCEICTCLKGIMRENRRVCFSCGLQTRTDHISMEVGGTRGTLAVVHSGMSYDNVSTLLFHIRAALKYVFNKRATL